MQTEVNRKHKVVTGNEVSIAKGMVGFIVISLIFFVGIIAFANAQQQRTLEANMVEVLSSSSDISFEFVGTEDSPQLRKFYLAKADGEEFIVRVYQNNRTVLDAFSLTEKPHLAEQFQNSYGVDW
ncbi:hypothetical protein [Alkalihalophilus marmarensis]|jgi:hypothetical protein|uniref:Uncharacterized protein n=1 Tax=Alkalihalophilus marmarensis DSM 21297 TaxID=1188261 RepID=U6SKA9_9BACI|nr:hypothetical protein [Alkalihalophilus marmarensis]ERN51081.1 hypothetical protein A33I_21005 [Alkalihalophilus marmarensis DSM 21297]MCM3490609.1 hypothetical protein [Alkalihalophilus marmarensis]MED1603229.1 hypothetical protein [Alkalihalophilus marmarensis]